MANDRTEREGVLWARVDHMIHAASWVRESASFGGRSAAAGDTSMLRASFDDVSNSATAVAPGPVGGTVVLGLDRLNRVRGDEEGPAPASHNSVRRLAETTCICRCQSVTKGAIVAAIRA